MPLSKEQLTKFNGYITKIQSELDAHFRKLDSIYCDVGDNSGKYLYMEARIIEKLRDRYFSLTNKISTLISYDANPTRIQSQTKEDVMKELLNLAKHLKERTKNIIEKGISQSLEKYPEHWDGSLGDGHYYHAHDAPTNSKYERSERPFLEVDGLKTPQALLASQIERIESIIDIVSDMVSAEEKLTHDDDKYSAAMSTPIDIDKVKEAFFAAFKQSQAIEKRIGVLNSKLRSPPREAAPQETDPLIAAAPHLTEENKKAYEAEIAILTKAQKRLSNFMEKVSDNSGGEELTKDTVKIKPNLDSRKVQKSINAVNKELREFSKNIKEATRSKSSGSFASKLGVRRETSAKVLDDTAKLLDRTPVSKSNRMR